MFCLFERLVKFLIDCLLCVLNLERGRENDGILKKNSIWMQTARHDSGWYCDGNCFVFLEKFKCIALIKILDMICHFFSSRSWWYAHNCNENFSNLDIHCYSYNILGIVLQPFSGVCHSHLRISHWILYSIYKGVSFSFCCSSLEDILHQFGLTLITCQLLLLNKPYVLLGNQEYNILCVYYLYRLFVYSGEVFCRTSHARMVHWTTPRFWLGDLFHLFCIKVRAQFALLFSWMKKR